MAIFRDVAVPGVYVVQVDTAAGPLHLELRDNELASTAPQDLDDPDAIDLTVSHRPDEADPRGTLVLDAATLGRVPPWSDLGAITVLPPMGSASLRVLSRYTHSPFGEVAVLTTYRGNEPIHLDIDTEEALASRQGADEPVDLAITRRFALFLLNRAGHLDLLESLRGGRADGEWNRLMLLAGVVEDPALRDARAAASLSRPELTSLAYVTQLWSTGRLLDLVPQP